MIKSDIILLANLGVANITNHSLDPAHAYKVVKFRKAVKSAIEELSKDEDALRKDAGIEDAQAFDEELAKLRTIQNPDKAEKDRLAEMEAKLKRFVELRVALLDEEVSLDCKAMPYAEWHKLQNENKDRELNGRKEDILSGYVEDILEGVLWETPAE